MPYIYLPVGGVFDAQQERRLSARHCGKDLAVGEQAVCGELSSEGKNYSRFMEALDDWSFWVSYVQLPLFPFPNTYQGISSPAVADCDKIQSWLRRHFISCWSGCTETKGWMQWVLIFPLLLKCVCMYVKQHIRNISLCKYIWYFNNNHRLS